MEPGARLKPIKEFRIYRRNLPHWEQPGGVYFVTFKSAEGFNLPEEGRNITFDSIKFHIDKKYKLKACVVMESHVHLILRPLEKAKGAFYSLAEIMHSIKSYSANRIQKYLHKKGNVWLDENYDKITGRDACATMG